MSNIARFSALQGFPVSWKSIGAESIGIKVIVEITTDQDVTKEYMEQLAKEIEKASKSVPGRFLYDVTPMYWKGGADHDE